MNHKLLIATALSFGMAVSPLALAKSGDDHGRGHGHRDDGWHGERERHYDGPRYQVNVYEAPRGYQRRDWHRGDRVPVVYRSTRYVVNDYRTYRLAPPPRHYNWVRVDNDVVLTGIATGVVAAVVYDIFR